MVSDRDRHELFVALLDRLGQGPADTMMQMLPPVGWADVARASDLEGLRIGLRGEMAELRGEMAELRSELRAEMAELRAELRGELKAEVASLRNQLFAANVATTAAVAGLVLAAAKLA
jgi:ribosomal protein L29